MSTENVRVKDGLESKAKAGSSSVETRGKGFDFIVIRIVALFPKTVGEFLPFHMKCEQIVRSDASPALHFVANDHVHKNNETQRDKAFERLPLIHIIIGNMKKFLDGKFSLRLCLLSPEIF